MWALVVIVPAIVGGLSSLMSAVGANRFVVAAFSLDMYQRRRGFKSGEGWATSKTGEGHGSIIALGYKNDIDFIGERLSQLASFDLEGFSPYLNKRFAFTLSEGKTLIGMLSPLELLTQDVAELGAMLRENPDNEQYLEATGDAISRLRAFLQPIKNYLEEFPKKRVHPIVVQ